VGWCCADLDYIVSFTLLFTFLILYPDSHSAREVLQPQIWKYHNIPPQILLQKILIPMILQWAADGGPRE